MRRMPEKGANPRVLLPIIAGLFSLISGPALAGQLGAKAPEFRLQDTAGNAHSLSSYAGRTVILFFWSFKCPVSLAYDERVNALRDRFGAGKLVVLGVDSNSNESAAEIRRNAENLRLTYPILLDEDGSLADKLQATLSPSFYLIDSQGILRYQGALDNSRKPSDRSRVGYLEQALDDLFAGRPVAAPESAPSGCAIRRRTF